jgi:hypothetical protein
MAKSASGPRPRARTRRSYSTSTRNSVISFMSSSTRKPKLAVMSVVYRETRREPPVTHLRRDKGKRKPSVRLPLGSRCTSDSASCSTESRMKTSAEGLGVISSGQPWLPPRLRCTLCSMLPNNHIHCHMSGIGRNRPADARNADVTTQLSAHKSRPYRSSTTSNRRVSQSPISPSRRPHPLLSF